MSNEFFEMKESEKQEMGMTNSNVIVGISIILVGGVLFLRNIFGFEFENWWVLFMLIPLGGMGMKMWELYQANGRISTGLIIAMSGVAITAVIFLFNLSWGLMWPIFFMLGGVSMLLNHRG